MPPYCSAANPSCAINLSPDIYRYKQKSLHWTEVLEPECEQQLLAIGRRPILILSFDREGVGVGGPSPGGHRYGGLSLGEGGHAPGHPPNQLCQEGAIRGKVTALEEAYRESRFN